VSFVDSYNLDISVLFKHVYIPSLIIYGCLPNAHVQFISYFITYIDNFVRYLIV